MSFYTQSANKAIAYLHLNATNEVQNKKKYSQQKIFIIQIADYIYLVPFVEDEAKIFLKAIIPSRKATKKYFKL